MATLLKSIYADDNYYGSLNARNRFRVRLDIYRVSQTDTAITLRKRWCVEVYSASSLSPEKFASSASYSYDGGSKTGSSLQLGPGSYDAAVWESSDITLTYAQIAGGTKLTYGAGSAQYSASSGTKYSRLSAGSYTPPVPAFEISYKSDVPGASSIPSSQWKDYGTTATISSASPILQNAIFDDKWLGSDNNDYDSGDTYVDDANLTLTAYWKPTATLSYNANGGSNQPPSQSATAATSATNNLGSISISTTVSSSIPTPPDSTKRFVGWSRTQSTTTGDIDPGDTITLSMGQNVLYAIWGAATNTLNVPDTLMWGTASTLSITRIEGGSSQDAITYSCGSVSGTIMAKGSGTTATFTPVLADLAPEFTDTKDVEIVFTIETFDGDVSFGTSSVVRTITIPDSAKPVVESISALHTGTYAWTDAYVQNKTQVMFVCNTSALYGATVSYVNMTFGGTTKQGVAAGVDTWQATFDLPISGNGQNVSIVAVDTRGFTSAPASMTNGINVVAYTAPVIGALTNVQFDNGIKVIVNTTVMADNLHNSTYGSYRIDYQKIGTSYTNGEPVTLENAVTTETTTLDMQPSGPIEDGAQYNIRITVIDNLGGSIQRVYTLMAATVDPVIDVFEDKSVAFGAFATKANNENKNVRFGSDTAPWDVYAGPALSSIGETLYANVTVGSRKVNWSPVEIPEIDVDDALDITSDNPVQNAVITAAINNISPTFGYVNGWQYILWPNGYIHAFGIFPITWQTANNWYLTVSTPGTMYDTNYTAIAQIADYRIEQCYAGNKTTTSFQIATTASDTNSGNVYIIFDGYTSTPPLPRLANYAGSMSVTPSNSTQTLPTQDTSVLSDITIDAIPYVETPNGNGIQVDIG